MIRPLAGLALGLLLSSPLHAQSSAQRCPTLPASAGLTWERLDGPDFVFCKAKDADGGQAFGVMLTKSPTFKPRRANREEKVVIGGRELYWYRGEGLADPLTRETVLELPGGGVAQISLRAREPGQLAERLRLAESLDFAGTALSSN